MNQNDQIYAQLRKVNDPELNINVVDLGLIYDVTLSYDGDRIDYHDPDHSRLPPP